MSNTPERITLKKIWLELLEQLNLERGLGYTVKQFLLRPAYAVEEYLNQNREVYVKPFNFLLLTTAVTTFLMVQFVINKNQGIADITSTPEWERIPELLKPGLELLLIGIRKYFNLFYLSNLPTVVLAAYWVFRKKYDFNLAEYFVINIYIFSVQSLLYIFTIPFLVIKSVNSWGVLPSMFMVLYFVFAYMKIFQLKLWQALGYSLLIYLVAQVLNLVLMAIIILFGMFFA